MCTRILWSDNSVAVVASRTMDWHESDDPELWALPAGMTRDGAWPEGARQWTSRFSSASVLSFGVGITESVNEAGLAVHLLYLESTVYEPADDRPVVANIRVAQWLVDTCATVAEAVTALDTVRIGSVEVRGHHLGAHLAMEDASGDSAILELIDGAKVIHHGPGTRVMANDPTYDQQLVNLARYRDFGGELPPPGDILSVDRFVRASYFLRHLPKPATYEEAVAGVVLLAHNVSVPPGAPYDDFSVYPTWWVSATDVTDHIFYFQPSTSPNLVWVELDEMALAAGSPARRLDPGAPGLVGNVGTRFEDAPAPF